MNLLSSMFQHNGLHSWPGLNHAIFPQPVWSYTTSRELFFYSRVITADPLSHGWVKHALIPADWSALHSGSYPFLFITHNGIIIGWNVMCVFLCTDSSGACERDTVDSRWKEYESAGSFMHGWSRAPWRTDHFHKRLSEVRAQSATVTQALFFFHSYCTRSLLKGQRAHFRASHTETGGEVLAVLPKVERIGFMWWIRALFLEEEVGVGGTLLNEL